MKTTRRKYESLSKLLQVLLSCPQAKLVVASFRGVSLRSLPGGGLVERGRVLAVIGHFMPFGCGLQLTYNSVYWRFCDTIVVSVENGMEVLIVDEDHSSALEEGTGRSQGYSRC